MTTGRIFKKKKLKDGSGDGSEKALYNHHPPSVDLESTGKEEEGKAEKQLEKGPGGRRSGDGLQLERNREAGPGQGTLAVCCGWPMPPAGR